MDEQTKSLELLAMERLLRNESRQDEQKTEDAGAFGFSIIKKEMKKKANDKEFTFNFYTSSTADERSLNKEREQFMCPLTNEIIIQGCTLRCGCTFSLEALRLYYRQ